MIEEFGQDLLLLNRLASGGMAQIYLAKQVGAGDFEKLVVVKRIFPHYADNKDFREMFRREVSVSANLQHPNIVQVYRTGERDGFLYLVMEFVDGKDLNEALIYAEELDVPIPMPVICFIVSEVAKGLSYAHSYRDTSTGQARPIIHRDISPHNIMIGFNGNVKIIDFGIAKAADFTDLTRTGMVKGKLPYVAPEQLNQGKSDVRSDIFSLGVVFFELLAQRELFPGEHTAQIIKQVTECHIPDVQTFNEEVDSELKDILEKALARDPAERYQTGDELSRTLSEYISRKYPKFVQADVASFIKILFKSEIERNVELRKALSGRAQVYIKRRKYRKLAKLIPPVISSDYRRALRWAAVGIILSLSGLLVNHALIEPVEPKPPYAVPSLIGWFDADSIKLDNGAVVDAWIERSQMKFNAVQEAPRRQPILKSNMLNGLPALHFDGQDDFLEVNTVAELSKASSGLTVIYVARATADRVQYVWSLQEEPGVTDVARAGFFPGHKVRAKASKKPGYEYFESESLDTESWAVYSLVVYKRRLNVYRNGENIISEKLPEDIDFSKAQTFTIGQEWDLEGPSDFFSGLLKELIVYSTALDDRTRRSVEKYLLGNYGLSKNQ